MAETPTSAIRCPRFVIEDRIPACSTQCLRVHVVEDGHSEVDIPPSRPPASMPFPLLCHCLQDDMQLV